MTNYKFKTIKSIPISPVESVYACVHCGGDVRVRKPTATGPVCDHLYYPDNCDHCKRLYRIENRKGIVDRFLNKLGLKRV